MKLHSPQKSIPHKQQILAILAIHEILMLQNSLPYNNHMYNWLPRKSHNNSPYNAGYTVPLIPVTGQCSDWPLRKKLSSI